MKRVIIFIVIILAICFLVNKITVNASIIPDEAIRLRVLANSNTPEDQYIKSLVSEKIQVQIVNILKNTQTIEEARAKIINNLKPIEDIIEYTLKEENINYEYDVDFAYHYFPNKEYKGVTYDEGYYESILVTLGKGEGNNWWCVLFPPLCLLEAEESEEVEYKFFIKEIIEKYF